MVPSAVNSGFSTLGSLRSTSKSSATNSAPASVSLKTGAALLTSLQARSTTPLGAPPHTELLVQSFPPAVAASASSLLPTRRDSYRDEDDDVMTSYDVTSGLADEVVLSYDANFNSTAAPTPSGDSTKSPTNKEGASTLSTGGGDNSSYGSRTLDSKDVDGMIDSRSESDLIAVSPSKAILGAETVQGIQEGRVHSPPHHQQQ